MAIIPAGTLPPFERTPPPPLPPVIEPPHVITTRERAGVGALIQLFGVILLFAVPIGTVIGIVLIVVGTKKTYARKCSECAGKVNEGAKVCQHCRVPFTGTPVTR